MSSASPVPVRLSSIISVSSPIAHSLAEKGRREGRNRIARVDLQTWVRPFARGLGPFDQTPESISWKR